MAARRKTSRPVKTHRVRFFVVGLILGILIPWVLCFAATGNPYTLSDVIGIRLSRNGSRLISQKDVPYSLEVGFDRLLLEKAEQDSSLRVYSQKASVWEKAKKNGIWAPLYSQSKNIIFHGIGEYYVDLTRIQDDDISVDPDARTVEVRIPAPELRVLYDQAATEFLDTNNAPLRFGEMEITPEMMSALEEEAMTRIREEIEADADSAKTARDYAVLAIRGLFEPVLKKTLEEAYAPYYSLNVVVEEPASGASSFPEPPEQPDAL